MGLLCWSVKSSAEERRRHQAVGESCGQTELPEPQRSAERLCKLHRHMHHHPQDC